MCKDDGFPQYICSSCLLLLDSAYQFKTLCERTDFELRNTDAELIKNETISYAMSEPMFVVSEVPDPMQSIEYENDDTEFVTEEPLIEDYIEDAR